LDLPAESPVLSLPWIVTFGPLSDDEEWEPVVCGPYERDHALALAESVVADEDLMAVVEPVLPHTTVDEIRAEIVAAKTAAEEAEDEELEVDFDDEDEDDEEEAEYEEYEDESEEDVDHEGHDHEGHDHEGHDGHDHDGHDHEDDEEEYEADEEIEPSPPPSPEEIRAGFARIAARLTGSA
jgi:hypothetical protein